MEEKEKKFNRMLQTDMPRYTLEDAVEIANSLRDNFAGKGANPVSLAKSLSRSPSSSSWRFLTGAALAYGLTDGAYNAPAISLTALGRQITSPTEEGADRQGIVMALLRPTILKDFYSHFDGNRFPKDEIAKNILREAGVPSDRLDEALKVVLANGKFAHILTEINGGLYVQLAGHNIAPIRSSETPITETKDNNPAINPPSVKTDGILTPYEMVSGKFVIHLHPELFKDKNFRKEFNAFMDAADNLTEIIEGKKPRGHDPHK